MTATVFIILAVLATGVLLLATSAWFGAAVVAGICVGTIWGAIAALGWAVLAS